MKTTFLKNSFFPSLVCGSAVELFLTLPRFVFKQWRTFKLFFSTKFSRSLMFLLPGHLLDFNVFGLVLNLVFPYGFLGRYLSLFSSDWIPLILSFRFFGNIIPFSFWLKYSFFNFFSSLVKSYSFFLNQIFFFFSFFLSLIGFFGLIKRD